MHCKGSGTHFSSTKFSGTICKSIHIHIYSFLEKEINLEFFHSLIFNLVKPVLHIKRYRNQSWSIKFTLVGALAKL